MSFLKKKAFSSRVTASRTTAGRPSNKERHDVAEMIAGETDSGRNIIRFMVNAMEGRLEECTPAVKLAAATWLGNYYFGKPVETTVQLSMSKTHDSLPSFTDEQLEDLLRGGIDRLPQGLLGGDSQGDSLNIRHGQECVDVSGVGDMDMREVQPEDVRQGPVEEVPGTEDVPAVVDGQGDGEKVLGPGDGPTDGEPL
jgi:hypothetical protein